MSVNAVQYGTTGTTDTDLFLKVYSGKFVETWRAMPKLAATPMPVIHRQTMTNVGVSYQILQWADLPEPEGEYSPGNDLLGQDFGVDEVTVSRDKYVIAHQWVPRDAMKTAHFDILGRLGRSHPRKIGMVMDRRLFITADLAARAVAKIQSPTGLNIHPGGNRVTRTGGTVAAAYPLSPTGAANFRDDLKQLGRFMDEDNIPPENRWMWITPYMRQVLSYDNTAQVYSKDYINTGEGGNIMRREVILIDGFKLVDIVNTTSNNGSIPDQNITTGPTKYQANFTVQASTGTPVAQILCEGPDGDAAISMGTWEEVQHVVQYYPEKLSWLVASFILAGIGQMSPTCAGSIEVIT